MTNHEPAHTLSYAQLGVVIGALFILTAVTIGASYVHMGALNVWIALVIASSKASLVLLY
ncbi:MAG: caa(3)-type oxidase subunit 4, partial [Proteobacteria bacterium]|nr:caa(3)-type oxidase subunit 4 [Pseudomonadota bacterium]